MINNLRFELSFKNIAQLENKLNFCKFNGIKYINITITANNSSNHLCPLPRPPTYPPLLFLYKSLWSDECRVVQIIHIIALECWSC